MPRPAWDRETAIAMGEKGRAAKEARKALLAKLASDVPTLARDLTYHERVKGRVRVQMNLILDRIDEEAGKPTADGTRIDRLASALERLFELERVADNRPLPGTLRPDKPKSKPAQLPPAPDTPS